MEVFNAAARYTLGIEKGFVNDPLDSGGATKFGVTIKTLELFREKPQIVHDVQALTESDALNIYFQLYWYPSRLGDILQAPIAIAIFDMAILFSVNRAIRMAQKALVEMGHVIKIDGIPGPITISFLNICSVDKFLDCFFVEILEQIDRVIDKKPSNIKFKKGWTNRAHKILTLK